LDTPHLKIIFITSSSTKSGGSRQAYYLARGLADRGHEVEFFVPYDSGLPDLDPGLAWSVLPEKRSAWRNAMARALPKTGPCIIQAFHNKAVKKLAWWGLFWRKKGIVTLGYRGVVFKPGNPLPYWSPGLDGFVVNSKACARTLQRLGVGSKRLHVIYSGIPAGRVQPQTPADKIREDLGIGPGEIVLGTVTGAKDHKGVHVLLEAFAKAGQQNARLVVVGVRPKKWSDQHRDLGLEGRVVYVPHTECVADYLRVFDVFVLPSLSESLPNTLLEALSMRLPVAASAVGGVPEVVRGNGLLFKPGDVDDMARALATMCSDGNKRKQWAQASLNLACEFSLENKIQKTEALYLGLLKARGLV